MDSIWSFDGSFGVSDSVASLRILTDSLPLVVNEPLFDRFFSGDLIWLIWCNSLVSLVLWRFKEYLWVHRVPWGIQLIPETLKAKFDDLYLCRGSKYLCLCVQQLYRYYLCRSSDFCICRVRPQEVLKVAIFLNPFSANRIPIHSLWINSCAFLSRFNYIQKSSVLIYQSMTFPCGSCAVRGRAIGITFVVFGLQVSPSPELILVLDIDLGHDATSWFWRIR